MVTVDVFDVTDCLQEASSLDGVWHSPVADDNYLERARKFDVRADADQMLTATDRLTSPAELEESRT